MADSRVLVLNHTTDCQVGKGKVPADAPKVRESVGYVGDSQDMGQAVRRLWSEQWDMRPPWKETGPKDQLQVCCLGRGLTQAARN